MKKEGGRVRKEGGLMVSMSFGLSQKMLNPKK